MFTGQTNQTSIVVSFWERFHHHSSVYVFHVDVCVREKRGLIMLQLSSYHYCRKFLCPRLCSS